MLNNENMGINQILNTCPQSSIKSSGARAVWGWFHFDNFLIFFFFLIWLCSHILQKYHKELFLCKNLVQDVYGVPGIKHEARTLYIHVHTLWTFTCVSFSLHFLLSFPTSVLIGDGFYPSSHFSECVCVQTLQSCLTLCGPMDLT